jgi:Glycosyl transferases group 1
LRIFQNTSAGRRYGRSLMKLISIETTFARKLAAFHSNAYDAPHTLAPVLAGEEYAFYTHGDSAEVQRAWARENGLSSRATLETILLAQIEAHKAEVFYNLDLDNFDGRFARRLPSSVRAKIGWHAAPIASVRARIGLDTASVMDTDWNGFLMVNNFPSILEAFRSRGLRAAYFAPAHDPVLDTYAQNDQRDIDVLFVGGYSQYHTKRVAVLDAVAGLDGKHNVVFALDRSRLNRIAETPLGVLGPLRRYRRPKSIRALAKNSVFGRAYYDFLARTKIVLNAAIDMAGSDRGNMRCWEALGARTLLLSDEGNYPTGMVDGETIRTYRSPEHAIELIEESLRNCEARQSVASAGYDMIRTRYSKAAQWASFQRLVAEHF